MTILEPANVPLAGIPAPAVAFVVLVAALLMFSYVMFRRIQLLRLGAPDDRFSNIGERIRLMLVYGFGQWRQPRYLGAGILHILLFAGFMILSLRSLTLIGRGFSSEFHLPLLTGSAAFSYEVLKDYVVLMVLAVCIIAIIRRAVFRPARYAHNHTGGHENEAYIILGLVAALMVTDMIFDGSALKIERKERGRGFVSCCDTCRPVYVVDRSLYPECPARRRLLEPYSRLFWIAELPAHIEALPCYHRYPQRFLRQFEQGGHKTGPMRRYRLDGTAGMRCGQV